MSHAKPTYEELERRCHQAEAERDRFLNCSLDLLCVAGFDGYFQQLNPAWTTTLGWTPEELKSKPWLEFVHPDDREATVSARNRLMQNQAVRGFENRFRCKDGSYRWLSWDSFPLSGEQLIFAVVRDITEHKQEEESLLREREFNRTLLESLGEGVVACDADGKLAMFNRTAREWHGLDPRPLPPEQWAEHFDLYGPDGRTPLTADTIPLARAFRGETVQDAEMAIVAKGQPPRYILANAAPILGPDHKRLGAVTVMHDITEYRRAQEELARHRDHLEELVGKRTRELEESRQKLQQSERLASVGTFAAGIAHQMNNPLGEMMLSVDMALRSLDQPKRLAKLLQEERSEIERCSHIVKDVLNFAQQRPAKKLPLDLNEIVRRSMESTRKYALAHGVAMVAHLVEPLDLIMGNSTELERAVINLIHNAVQACSEEGRVTIETRRTADNVRLLVRDNGCGMTPDQIQRAFDPFYTTRLAKGGTGLGLSTVHGTVVGHGGTIEIASEPDKGAVITIEFPRCADMGIGARRTTPAAAPSARD